MQDSRPIGIFDSGVGGLTVLKELMQAFPQESFLYFGDTARLPYGTKSADTVHRYAEQIIDHLLKFNVKAIVIACNSASSSYKAKEKNQIPIFNVIEPGVEEAIKNSESFRIGIVGTRTTINSQAYRKAILQKIPTAQIFEQPCPLWVSLVEEGWIDDPITNLIVYRYLAPLLQNNIDTLVLGCTHYPVLTGAIQRVTTNKVTLVDSGKAMALILQEKFASGILTPNLSANKNLKIMATDTNAFFSEVAQRILHPYTIDQMEHVDL